MNTRSKKCIDHEGNEFHSQTEMCCYWKVTGSTYISRLKQGLSVEMALTKKTNREEVTDHLGNTYKTLGEMCSNYEKGIDIVCERLKRGWSLEKALTQPIRKINSFRECTDHLGEHFSSISDMCVKYKINRTLYNYRIKAGYNQEDALTKPVKKQR